MIDEHAISRPGETLRVDTGCLVALQPSVSYDVQFVGKVKTALFGGEGLFFAMVTGPGRVWLQSLPLSRLADRIPKAAPAWRAAARKRARSRRARQPDRRRQLGASRCYTSERPDVGSGQSPSDSRTATRLHHWNDSRSPSAWHLSTSTR